MASRIEVITALDARAEKVRLKLNSIGSEIKLSDIRLVDAYTIDTEAEFSEEQLKNIARILSNPITQQITVCLPASSCSLQPLQPMQQSCLSAVYPDSFYPNSFYPDSFNWAIEISYLPGVTDNVATTARECIEDLLQTRFQNTEKVYTSQVYFLSGEGDIDENEAKRIAEELYNPLIQSARIKKQDQFVAENGMGINIPRISLTGKPCASVVDILNIKDKELALIGKLGIPDIDEDGWVMSRRGPLSLDITNMKATQQYFREKWRNPTDVELESIAQTGSEHCKHTIFADPLDDIEEGIFRRYIRGATETIIKNRKRAGRRGRTGRADRTDLKEFCVSVFKDNSGAIFFDQVIGPDGEFIDYLITHKVETHNSPSALDPFGGAITGIVGVNRDAIGFGLGAKPIANVYGFCFGHPDDDKPIFKERDDYLRPKQKMLSPRRIMDGVIEGVNVGGNCSGIPTPQGFVYFDDRYKGKPLVFVGTLGLIPAEISTPDGKTVKSYVKRARPGDYIVMLGGRVGKDGIHGATFSSEAIDSGSPATAVQIGDPITQKKLSDAIQEARDLMLYSSITDNGAGGLSCSVAEMARESGGCYVELEKVPLKYHGLAPWEIWISESQERMTLAVPPCRWDEFKGLMDKRGVEASVIGLFTGIGRCIVDYKGENVMDLSLDFLHDGLPKKHRITSKPKDRILHQDPDLFIHINHTPALLDTLSRPNIASFEFISQQYDHEVQGTSVIKPLQGRGRVNGDATVIRPLFNSDKGIVLSQAAYPSYSELDPYRMAAASIDTAVRNVIAAGANPEKIALLDNFCWCSSDDPERLWQLNEAARACYDYAVAYGTPFISGKDSMFNDFKGYDKNGRPKKISVPPTLLISAIGIIDDCTKAMTIDAKASGDAVYLIGNTHKELAGSEHAALVRERKRKYRKYDMNETNVPSVNADKNKKAYYVVSEAIDRGLVASCISVNRGGLAVALAKTAMAGKYGMELFLDDIPGDSRYPDNYVLFSESQGRLVVTVSVENIFRLEDILLGAGVDSEFIGYTRDNNKFVIKRSGRDIINTSINQLLKSYRSTFRGF